MKIRSSLLVLASLWASSGYARDVRAAPCLMRPERVQLPLPESGTRLGTRLGRPGPMRHSSGEALESGNVRIARSLCLRGWAFGERALLESHDRCRGARAVQTDPRRLLDDEHAGVANPGSVQASDLAG